MRFEEAALYAFCTLLMLLMGVGALVFMFFPTFYLCSVDRIKLGFLWLGFSIWLVVTVLIWACRRRFNHQQVTTKHGEKRCQSGFLFLPKTALNKYGQAQTRWLEWAGWLEVFDSEEEYELYDQEPHWNTTNWVNI